MAGKELTAKVRIDASQAHKTIDKLVAKINKINEVVNKSSGKSGLEKKIEKQILQQEKLKQATLKTQLAEARVTAQKNKSAVAAQKVSEATAKAQIAEQRLALQTEKTKFGIERIKNLKDQVANKSSTIASRVMAWAKNQQMVTSATRSTNNVLGAIGNKLKMLASTYLGIMGMKAGIKTSDTITATQNKLNNLNGGDTKVTQEQMDKMYASANKVRMAYTDMMSNASKSMTLAGDAFQGNMDNAIRFQEIMAETYALGGASAEEMSTSMYQMIQALGSGTLAGDELRSVREGAPLAYKAIENYVQGIMAQSDATKEYATKSLKDIASAGLVTSEMVVAAVMNSGDKIDEQFDKTAMTFGQAWDRIKNAAVKAFEPVSNALNQMLNRAAKNGAFEKIEQAFWNISKVIQIVFQVIYDAIVWIADNWNWLQHIVVAGLIIMATMWLYQAGVAVISCIQTMIAMGGVAWSIMIGVAAVLALIYVFYLWKTGAIDTCQAITYALLIVGVAVVLIGIIVALMTGNIVTLIIGAVILLLGLIFMFFEEVCYGAGWLAAWIVNIVFAIVNIVVTAVYLLLTLIWNIVALIVNAVMAGAMAIGTVVQWIVAFIVNLVMGVANSIVAISHNCVAAVINVATALWNSISAICQNIGIAFQNAWNGALSAFWNFIADCLEGLDWLMQPLEKIAELFGKSFDAGGFANSVRSKASGHQQKSYVSVSDAWSSGMNSVAYKSVGDAWSNGWNTMDFANMGDMVSAGWNTMNFASFGDAFNSGMGTLDYVDPNKWGSTAGNWGAGIKDSINAWGSKFQNDGTSKATDTSAWLDKLGKSLGLDFGNMAGGSGGFPSASNPDYDTKGAYKSPSVDDMIKNALGDDVGDIAGNTGKLADSMDLSEEDLEYLRKIAEMEWKKEYTTAEIKVDMSNYNTINGENDLDGIVTKLADKLYEEMNVVANGVYA